MPIEVPMSKLSPTMDTGQIVKWLVKVGDKVTMGQPYAEVQTDKAVMNAEVFDEGTVAYLDLKEGEETEVGNRVMVLAKKNENPSDVAKWATENSKSGSAKRAEVNGAKTDASVNAKPAEAEAQVGVTANADAGAAAEAVSDGGRIKSSPLARKIAKEHNLNINQVSGSGPGGRVVRRDVETALSQAAKPKSAAAPQSPGGSKRKPLAPMRKTIASRMSQAWQVPVVHLSVDIRLDEVMRVRESLNERLAKAKIKLSVGDFVTKAVAMTLRRHPEMNAHFLGDAILEHDDVNIGIAVALENGLIVPVLKNADRLGLKEIRTGTELLARSARENKLTPDSLSGGTFTISNLGMFGVKAFDAILNIPEVGILAVSAAEKRAVVEGDDLIIATVMTITLTADHRAIDGAVAAEFLRTLKGYLEDPATMLV